MPGIDISAACLVEQCGGLVGWPVGWLDSTWGNPPDARAHATTSSTSIMLAISACFATGTQSKTTFLDGALITQASATQVSWQRTLAAHRPAICFPIVPAPTTPAVHG